MLIIEKTPIPNQYNSQPTEKCISKAAMCQKFFNSNP